MTVGEWLDSRPAPPSGALIRGLREVLAADLGADVSSTTDVCLRAADQALRRILDARRFDRAGALDLLVVDALTTYAYEYASETATGDIGALARDGIRRFGDVAAAHG